MYAKEGDEVMMCKHIYPLRALLQRIIDDIDRLNVGFCQIVKEVEMEGVLKIEDLVF